MSNHDINTITIEVDLYRIKSLSHFRRVMASIFRFPSYFGNNSEAMNECMCDLSWYSEDTIYAVFINLDKMKDQQLKQDIRSDLEGWHDYWNNCTQFATYHERHPDGKTVIIEYNR